MKWTFASVGILIFGFFGILIITFFNEVTVSNEQDYYTLKEAVEAAMLEAVDATYYRLTGSIKINQEKFVENFTRRFAQVATYGEGNYDIEFYDISESPPKVSVRITDATNVYNIFGTYGAGSTQINVVNQVSAILDVYESGKIIDVGSLIPDPDDPIYTYDGDEYENPDGEELPPNIDECVEYDDRIECQTTAGEEFILEKIPDGEEKEEPTPSPNPNPESEEENGGVVTLDSNICPAGEVLACQFHLAAPHAMSVLSPIFERKNGGCCPIGCNAFIDEMGLGTINHGCRCDSKNIQSPAVINGGNKFDYYDGSVGEVMCVDKSMVGEDKDYYDIYDRLYYPEASYAKWTCNEGYTPVCKFVAGSSGSYVFDTDFSYTSTHKFPVDTGGFERACCPGATEMKTYYNTSNDRDNRYCQYVDKNNNGVYDSSGKILGIVDNFKDGDKGGLGTIMCYRND